MTFLPSEEIDRNNLDDKEFVKSKDCYYIIKQVFLDFIPETSFPTFDEWKDLVDKDELHEPTVVGFVPGAPARAGRSIAGFARKVGTEALKSSGFKMGTADEVLKSMRSAAEATIRQRAREVVSNNFSTFVDTGDGGTSKSDYVGGSRFNPSGLSQTLKPIDSGFRTDIEFQGQTRYWQDGKENSGPLFIKSGMPGLVSPIDGNGRDAQMWDFLQGPITMEWNSYIASKVTWTGRVVNLLTEININAYINRCIAACSVYYFWRRVISFTDDPRNRNAGMDALRDQLTPDDYNNLFNLRRELMQCAIPPFVHEFCFYMYNVYRQNHLPTSPLMLIMPFDFASTSDAYFTGAGALDEGESAVDIARGHLTQLKEFNNILSRALGSWGGIEPFEYTASPRVDYDYTTFWTNASYYATNSNGYAYYPRITNYSKELVYNIHTDAPDGWTSAMASPHVESDNKEGVGLFHPWVLIKEGTAITGVSSTYSTNKYTSCFMYHADSSNAGFYPVESAQTYQSLSGNTYSTILTTGTYHSFQKFGTERVILTSINALRQANFQFLELLYTQDLRKLGKSSGIRQGKEVSVSESGKNPYGGRKRRGKRGGKSSNKGDTSLKTEL